jgi:hypothetical protein
MTIFKALPEETWNESLFPTPNPYPMTEEIYKSLASSLFKMKKYEVHFPVSPRRNLIQSSK